MANAFDRYLYKQDLDKTRVLLSVAATSSFLFYYFMTAVNLTHQDWLPGRIAIAIASIISLALTFFRKIPVIWMRASVNTAIFLYLSLYSYLLYINDWSVFHRWSYFALLSIVSTTVLSWKDYIWISIVGFFVPILLSFSSSLQPIELWHFHLANLATLVVIGVSVRANFRYRQESINLTQKLVEHSKMLALGEMSAGVSHEINNPLMILMSSVSVVEEMIANENVDSKKAVNYLQKITRSAQRIANIVLALRHFSSSEDNERIAQHDVREIMTGTLDLFNEKLKARGIALVYNFPQNPSVVFCRKFQIMQILINLLNNAVEGALESKTKPEIKITIENNVESDFIRISIADSGPGVPIGVENKIMQPFFTTKELGKGTGLGLSISFGLARAHGGNLFFNSEVSRSCFTLDLPKSKS